MKNRFSVRLLAVLTVFSFLMPITSSASGWGASEFGPVSRFSEGVIEGNVGYIAGRGGSIFKTIDGGLIWYGATGWGTLSSYMGKPIDFTDLVMFDEKNIIATGIYSPDISYTYQDGDSAFVYSSDGGLTWKTSSYGSYDSSKYNNGLEEGFDGFVEFYSMVKTGDDSAVAVGQEGHVIISQDRGQTWERVTAPTSDDLLDVDAYGSLVIAVGENGTAIMSDDSGVSWESIDSLGDDLLAVDIVDDSFIFYLVATKDKIYRRTLSDFFSQWVEVVDFEDRFNKDVYEYWEDEIEIVDMDFYSYDRGAISTSFSESYLTEDGGETWELANFYADNATKPWYADDAIYDLHYDGVDDLYGFGVSDLHTDGLANNGAFYKYNFSAGALIKTHCESGDSSADPCRVVYYLDENGIRHPLLNESSFYGWYEDFSEVIEVGDDYMADLELGSAVPYRPGIQFIKFYTSNAVYAVSETGVLRRITNEATAKTLESLDGSAYGDNWAQNIILVSDAFFGKFEYGLAIDSADDYSAKDVFEAVSDLADMY